MVSGRMFRNRIKYHAAKKPMGAVATTCNGITDPGKCTGAQKCATPKHMPTANGNRHDPPNTGNVAKLASPTEHRKNCCGNAPII